MAQDGGAVESPAGPLNVLSGFRHGFCDCLTTRANALFELTDALLCSGGPLRSLVELTLTTEHRYGHGSLYDALKAVGLQVENPSRKPTGPTRRSAVAAQQHRPTRAGGGRQHLAAPRCPHQRAPPVLPRLQPRPELLSSSRAGFTPSSPPASRAGLRGRRFWTCDVCTQAMTSPRSPPPRCGR